MNRQSKLWHTALLRSAIGLKILHDQDDFVTPIVKSYNWEEGHMKYLSFWWLQRLSSRHNGFRPAYTLHSIFISCNFFFPMSSTSFSVSLILPFGCREKLSHYEPQRCSRRWRTFQMASCIFNMWWDVSMHILWISLQIMVVFYWSCGLPNTNTHIYAQAGKHNTHKTSACKTWRKKVPSV